MLDGRQAHVVALSMGGYVALTLALARPELVRSLVLAGTGAGGPDRVPRPQDVRDAYAAAIGLPFDEYGRTTMPMTFSPGWTERNPERFEEILAARGEHPTPRRDARCAPPGVLRVLCAEAARWSESMRLRSSCTVMPT